MRKVPIRQTMNWQELTDAVEHNSRCDILEIIDDAIIEAIEIGGITATKALMILKHEAKTLDFGDYDGANDLAEKDYEDRVIAIMDHLTASSN